MPSCPRSSRRSSSPACRSTGDHPMHPFIIDREGHMYVDLGSATNSCQIENRTLELARPRAVHRTRNPRRHLALRRQQERSALLAGGSLRDRAAQWRRLCFRFIGTAVRHAARPRSALAELAEALHLRAKRPTAGRGNRRAETRAPIMAGRSATTTASRTSSCWRRNMAATAARKPASAPRRPRRSPPCPRIGRRTIC